MEHRALQRWGVGRRRIVEIGVADGGSALGLRQAMPAAGTLYLIDPFHLSRWRVLNSQRRAARTAVSYSPNGNVEWIEQFSFEAARFWKHPIDLLFLDGDHTEQAVRQDWQSWHPFVVPGGVVVFHDARVFQEGWPTAADGPVKVVDDLFRRGRQPGWTIVDEVHSLVVVQRES